MSDEKLLSAIPAATAEDLRAFEVACGVESYPVTPWHRVAAHYKRRLAEAERLLRASISLDDGFDAQFKAIQEARKFLEAK